MIYLDNAATSLHKPPEVLAAVTKALQGMVNSGRGSFAAHLTGAKLILETRELLAELFGAEGPEQIAFTLNSTMSLNLALKGLLVPGDTVVTTSLEHNSVLRPLTQLQQTGVKVKIIGCLPEPQEAGKLDYSALKAALAKGGVKAVVCTHASNLTGNLVAVNKIGAWCKAAGALFIVDASQTAGVFPLHMAKDYIDVLCFTGHKSLMGPMGTGGLCVRRGLKVTPLVTGGTGTKTFSLLQPAVMPDALEAGTLNGHGLAGLHASLLALKKIGWDNIRQQEACLMREFYKLVVHIPHVHIYGDFTQPQRAPIVALNLGEEDASMVSDYLATKHNIYTRAGGHCAPLMHVALGIRQQGAVRFSFSYYNTLEEVHTAARALAAYEL